jgi:hypothetical protein
VVLSGLSLGLSFSIGEMMKGQRSVTVSEASREFWDRYYHWALSVAESEARAGFPKLRVFKGGMAWKTYQFAQELSEAERVLFARACLKRFYANVGGTGEALSSQEKAMLDRDQIFYLRQRGLELEIPARRRAGEKIKFASKKTLQSAVTKRFLAAFEQQGVELGPDNIPNTVGFTIKCAGWLVMTNFEFGRHESFIEYKHLIVGKVGGVNPDGTIFWPAPWLATFCWIGMTTIRWEYLLDEDVEPACDSVVELCRQVFDALPELLNGIERDKVTE